MSAVTFASAVPDLAGYALGLAFGAVGGAVGTLVALRTRLAMMARDTKDAMRQAHDLEARLEARIATMERRNMMMLRIMADIARKVGADARWDDAILKFLAEDAA